MVLTSVMAAEPSGHGLWDFGLVELKVLYIRTSTDTSASLGEAELVVATLDCLLRSHAVLRSLVGATCEEHIQHALLGSPHEVAVGQDRHVQRAIIVTDEVQ